MVDIADLNPTFGGDLDSLLAYARARGINPSVISGYRTLDLQRQLYANYQARLQGRPLPYPDQSAGNLAAQPGRSYHNYGLAADLGGISPAQMDQIQQWAGRFGLTGIPGDPNHFQLAGVSPDQLASYGPGGTNYVPPGGTTLSYAGAQPPPPTPPALRQAAPAQGLGGPAMPPPEPPPRPPITDTQTPPANQVASTSPTAGGTTLYSTQAPSSPLTPSNPFIYALGRAESGWRPIYSGVDKDYPGQPNSRSQSVLQIDLPTWQQFQKQAGVTAPSPMAATVADNIAVASNIPIGRWGANTRAQLHQQFGPFSNQQTMGELAAQFANAPSAAPANFNPSSGGQAFDPTMDPSIIAHGRQMGIDPAATQPGSVVTPPAGGGGPIPQLANAAKKASDALGPQQDQQAPPAPPLVLQDLARNVTPLAGMAPQLMGAANAAFGQPIRNQGMMGAGIVPAGGTTLNSMTQEQLAQLQMQLLYGGGYSAGGFGG